MEGAAARGAKAVLVELAVAVRKVGAEATGKTVRAVRVARAMVEEAAWVGVVAREAPEVWADPVVTVVGVRI